MSKNSKSRNYCFTINNYTEKDLEIINSCEEIKYVIYGKEIGESGTQHLQGYVEFKNPVELKNLKKINKRAHWEIRRGNQEQAIEYCKKDGKWTEKGIKGEQGKRNDLKQVYNKIKEGKKITEIIDENPEVYLKYNRGIEKIKNSISKPRDVNNPPNVIWICGESGIGKTKWVYDNYKDIYNKDCSKWWDNYEQNECILIDDFEIWHDYRDLLKVLDRYPYQGQIKGGYVNVNSPNIVITSEYEPKELWHGSKQLQIERRISKMINMKRTEVKIEAQKWLG